MSFGKRIFAVLIFLVGGPASARVFGFGDNWVAAYVRGTGATVDIGKDAYADTSGDQSAFKNERDYAFSGEVGFAFLISPEFSMRLGVEGYQVKGDEVTGTSGTTSLMTVESKVNSFMPGFMAEYAFSTSDTTRIYFLGGVSYATVNVSNRYELTADGQTAYGSSESIYKDAWYSKAFFPYHAGVGLEWYAFDNVTFCIETGYRQFAVNKFYYDANSTVIRGSAAEDVRSGSTVRDNNGKNVDLNLSGPFVGIAFKFYIPPLY